MAELRSLGQTISSYKQRYEALQLDVTEYLGDFLRLTVGGREVCTFKTQTDRSLDVGSLRRQHPQLCALFERGTPQRVLRIKGR